MPHINTDWSFIEFIDQSLHIFSPPYQGSTAKEGRLEPHTLLVCEGDDPHGPSQESGCIRAADLHIGALIYCAEMCSGIFP